jgi:hemin uptake protein HemP
MNDSVQVEDVERLKLSSSQITWTSEQLLRGSSEVVITHGGSKYRLQLTKNNKLILVK